MVSNPGRVDVLECCWARHLFPPRSINWHQPTARENRPSLLGVAVMDIALPKAGWGRVSSNSFTRDRCTLRKIGI